MGTVPRGEKGTVPFFLCTLKLLRLPRSLRLLGEKGDRQLFKKKVACPLFQDKTEEIFIEI